MWFIISIVVVFVVCTFLANKSEKQKAQQQAEATKEYTQNLYEKYQKAIHNLNSVLNEGQTLETLPIITCVTYEHRSNANNPSYYWITSVSHYVWIKDKVLYLFPVFSNKFFQTSCSNCRSEYRLELSDLVLKRVPIDRIMFYRQIGSVYTTTTGSGGESVFSPITGFHGKINPIKIESQIHDERTTQLFYDDGSKDQVMVLQDKDYYVLRKLLPQKDYQVVTISEATNNQSQEVFQRLEKLKELHQSSLISDEDYEKKKAEILDNI